MAARFSSFIARLTQAPARPPSAAVIRNLEHLFNTRKGCGSVIAEFGLGDYEAAATTRDAVLLLEREIERVTRRYEPRIVSPRVRLLGGLGRRTVRFELRGALWGGDVVLWLDVDSTTRQVDVTLEARE